MLTAFLMKLAFLNVLSHVCVVYLCVSCLKTAHCKKGKLHFTFVL